MSKPKKVGRPETKIDKDTFEKLCSIQCTLEEIASFFDCCDDTINNWCKKTYNDNFSGIYKKKSVNGKISLRRYQFKQAEKSPAMAIWLGKQILGQKDKVEYTDDNMKEINNSINNIADLINNPKKNRTEDDLDV